MRLMLLFLALFFSNVVVCVPPRGAMRRRASVSVEPLPAQSRCAAPITARLVKNRAWLPYHDRRHERLRRRHSISTPRGGRCSTVAPQPVLAEVDEQQVAFRHSLDLLRAYGQVMVAADHVQDRGVQELATAGRCYRETHDLGGLYRLHLQLVRRRYQEEAEVARVAVAFGHSLDLLRAYGEVMVAADHVQDRGVQELATAGRCYRETHDLGGLYRLHLQLVRRRDQEEAAARVARWTETVRLRAERGR